MLDSKKWQQEIYCFVGSKCHYWIINVITSEGPLEYTAYPDFSSYVCALQICRNITRKLCDDPSEEGGVTIPVLTSKP